MQTLMCKRLALGFLCFCSVICKAQSFEDSLQDVNNIVLDLTGLAEAYITPAAEGVAHQTTNGWFSTSKIENEPWQITTSVQGNLLFIPSKRRTFLIDENQLLNIGIVGSETTAFSPTSIGDDNTIALEGNIGEESFTFDTPEGINENTFWQPQFQVGVSIPYKTEIILRYAPRVSVSDAKYQSYGFGIHHSISQWFKSFNESSWNISTLLYYTNFDVSTAFDEIDLILGNINAIASDSNAFGFNLIGSKSIDRFTFFGAFNATTSTYNYSIDGSGDELLQILNRAIENIDNTQTFLTGNLGVRYEWNNFSIFSSLSFGEFQNMIIGLNYRFNTTSKVLVN